MASLIGSKVERKEDKKFLTGRGRYTADINLVHQTYAYFLRSPHARAKINSIDISKASKSSGVVKIFTGDDISREKIVYLCTGSQGEPMAALMRISSYTHPDVFIEKDLSLIHI